nr:MAG TPA: hypothetical protein [Caudoviricetes sp.]
MLEAICSLFIRGSFKANSTGFPCRANLSDNTVNACND